MMVPPFARRLRLLRLLRLCACFSLLPLIILQRHAHVHAPAHEHAPGLVEGLW
jgi:hypothetical protein